MDKFKIGDRAKDFITGYEGIILAYCRYSHNEDTVGMQKTSLNSNNMPDEFQWFDVARLEMVEESVFSDRAVKPEENPFNFLDVVKDSLIDKVKGPITGIYTYFTGCVRVEVTTGIVDEKGNLLKYTIPSKQAVLVKKAKIEKDVKKPGGPTSHPKMY
jgi:hypothetical protein